jgi:RNA polymerase sigma-70 factor (ECF subfamily)
MHEQIPIGTLSMTKREPNILSQVERAKHDPSAFTGLYRAYATRVYRYVYARVSNHQDAEDLTAQVFEAVLAGLKNFGGRKNFSAWLFTIARNKVVDSYRKNKFKLPLDAAQHVAADDPDPLHVVVNNEALDALAALVDELEPDKQELIHLRFAGGLTYAAIGEVVGKTESAVKMSIHRLLQQLHEQMEQKNE